jgi:hypothetical protein
LKIILIIETKERFFSLSQPFLQLVLQPSRTPPPLIMDNSFFSLRMVVRGRRD